MSKKFSLLACLASFAVSLIGCSNEKVAGTVTDTGNTLAETQVSGVVLRVDGTPASDAMVRMARMAVYDSVLHVPEQIEVVTDSEGVYSFAVDTLNYPMESCRGVAHIDASVTPDGESSSWNIGAAFIPFWPMLPVSETWHYRMEARIFCHGTLTLKVELEESEHVKAFWYGRMRADLVNDASQEMHRKLLERLKFETRLVRNTDLNLAQGF